jgi:lysophospholipase L1-like esterase
MSKLSAWVACFMLALLARSAMAELMSGESLVLAGETPGALLGQKIDPKSVVVRSTYLSGAGGTVFEADRDYRFDPETRTIARLSGSRIPDFATNVLFGKKDFDHGQFPGYGNTKFTVYVDYTCDAPLKLAEPRDVSSLLAKTVEKLQSGKPVKLIAFGDSITAGGEASSPELQYPALFAKHLRTLFPQAKIVLENGATGGDNTVNGLARLDEKVLTRQPDLVLVAFGMNDHNRPGVGGVEPPAFKENLKQIVGRIQKETGADVILLSTFPPNPEWHYGSHRMEQFAQATREAADDLRVPYADVFGTWKTVLARKDPSSLLGNNINHPNDFGHWLYAQALEALRPSPPSAKR